MGNTATPEGMPPVGSVWTKPAWMQRTIIGHRYNEWGKCWWVKIQHGTGTMEIPLSKWRKWADGARMVTPACEPTDPAWQEYEAAADWCAARGIRGTTNDKLPENLSTSAMELINNDPEAFELRVRDHAYARSMAKLSSTD